MLAVEVAGLHIAAHSSLGIPFQRVFSQVKMGFLASSKMQSWSSLGSDFNLDLSPESGCG